MSTSSKAKKEAVLTLEEISGFSTAATATAFADRYTARTRAFVEMGKLAFHLEHVAKLPKGKTLYGILQAKGVPQGTVNNAKIVSRFIAALVVPGLVSEERADEILTFRIANQSTRLLAGKSAVTLEPAALADLLNTGQKAAIGDELDSLDEHGLSIAEREAAETARIAEEERIAALNEAAANLPADPIPTPTAILQSTETEETEETETETETETEETETETETETEEEEEETAPAPAPSAPAPSNTVPITPPASAPAKPETLTGILAAIEAEETKSFDLDPKEMETVCERLGEWIYILSAHLQDTAKSAA